jgi:hypothetical protein
MWHWSMKQGFKTVYRIGDKYHILSIGCCGCKQYTSEHQCSYVRYCRAISQTAIIRLILQGMEDARVMLASSSIFPCVRVEQSTACQ